MLLPGNDNNKGVDSSGGYTPRKVQIIDISVYLKELDKVDQIEPQVRRIRKQ